MSSISIPSMAIFGAENEDTVARKLDTNLAPPRKAFFDRAVNCSTPKHQTKQNYEMQHQKSVVKKIQSPISSPKFANTDDFDFTYKEVEDQYESICPLVPHLQTSDVIAMLKSYLRSDTPPPVPEKELEMDRVPDYIDLGYDSCDDNLEKSLSFDLESSFQIDLPPLDMEI